MSVVVPVGKLCSYRALPCGMEIFAPVDAYVDDRENRNLTSALSAVKLEKHFAKICVEVVIKNSGNSVNNVI